MVQMELFPKKKTIKDWIVETVKESKKPLTFFEISDILKEKGIFVQHNTISARLSEEKKVNHKLICEIRNDCNYKEWSFIPF